ncbi:DUF7344 domain-containing protein [Natrinema salsiterrestre]|uniref:DUF7344 domain-containing protein n=1 Tax=Natrinema salsiterrestre TaxID=2950540 RepID=A0A9Q4KZ46_9EURY|nr:hypothetical protein [Natrinema salsiterrestre]MDF9746693.1 hypothetical protein [Natrinema salsiterrestre]
MGNDNATLELFALQTASDAVPVDEVIRLLANVHARNAVVYLHDHPAATLDELADALTAAAASADETIATPSDRDRVLIRLHHDILPRLADLDFIEFDSETNTVTETRIPDAVVAALGIDE